ncbi:MAG: ATP-dependent DNA helicase RecG [bacterium]
MDHLQAIKGIGAVTAGKLHAAGIATPADIVSTFPVKYEYHAIMAFQDAALGVETTLMGTVEQPAAIAYIRKRLTKLTVDVLIEDHAVRIIIFNREFLRSALLPGIQIVCTGHFENDRRHFIASDLVLRKNYREGILPVYDVVGITDRTFAKFVAGARPLAADAAIESLPVRLLSSRSLVGRSALLDIVHQPVSNSDVETASRRIKYEEFLRFGLSIHALKRANDHIPSEPKHYDLAKVRAFIRTLPFELTADQKQATNDIFSDLKKPRRMLRLLQGDVGSGKTICAAIAIFAVWTAGEQTAFMAPREILAHQHYLSLQTLFAPFGISVAFLSGAVKGSSRAEILAGLAAGTIAVVCGTHALIQEPVSYHRLGFVVIDEQHRFGVGQRKALREKGWKPDVLLMSATPIPRTLAIAVFGDMDVSSIRMLPGGRRPIITKIHDFADISAVVASVATEIAAGRQAYFIAPLVATDADSAALSVTEAADLVSRHLPSGFSVAVLHGRMKATAKDQIVASFRQGETDVLVATTVIEVGVDVPNATVMVILNADRFGLSQLHQLRGRVGRGGIQSYCHLITDVSVLTDDRLAILERTNDGFAISEEDLKRRGPGEVFGEEQTGIPHFKMANIVIDRDLLDVAFADARTLFTDSDPAAKVLVSQALSALETYHLD